MNKRIKIYIGLAIALSLLLVYSIVFVKDEAELQALNNPSYPVKKKLKPGEQLPDENANAPKFKPVKIPEEVLLGAKENDFYYYLFINPNRKTVFYSYDKNSTTPEKSELYHKKIKNALEKHLYYGNYKDYSATTKGMQIYYKNLFKDDENIAENTIKAKGTKEEKAILTKAERREAVRVFIEDCAKTLCIINAGTNEYVKIDKRNINTAVQTLKEYEKW